MDDAENVNLSNLVIAKYDFEGRNNDEVFNCFF